MNTLDELKAAISALSNQINEIEDNKLNENIIGLDDFLKLQRENAVILENLTGRLKVIYFNKQYPYVEKPFRMCLEKIRECLTPKPELTEDFIVPQNEIDNINKKIEDIESIVNGESAYLYDSSDLESNNDEPQFFSIPIIVDEEKFPNEYRDKIAVYMGRIYEYLDSKKFWETVVGTPVHAKINMLLRRLKSVLNVDDLCIFDAQNRASVTRYVDAIAPSIKSAYDIAESNVLWELETISNYIEAAYEDASEWRFFQITRPESDSSSSEIQDNDSLEESVEESDDEKEYASSENDDSTDDSSESDFDGTPNDDDTENFPTMEKEEPSEETPEIKAEESEIGLILESELNTSAPPQDETTSASSDVDWDEVATCLLGYVNSAKRWINNDSVGDTGQIQIINHMGNMLSTKSSDIAGSYPIFANTINQLAIDAKKPVKLPTTIEEFAESIK